MRITDNMRIGMVQRNLAALRQRHATLTNQISTGRKVLTPSDDPLAAAKLMRLSAQAARTRDYQTAIATAQADITLTESTLAQAGGLLARGRELAVQGANDTLTAEDRAVLALEVESLQTQLLATANTRGQRGYLFSGSQVDTPALAADGSYTGDEAVHEVEISPGVRSRVNVTGATAFTAAGGTDAFGALEDLRQALLAGDASQVTGTLANLEASRNQIVRAQAEAGLIMNRLDTADEALSVTAFELARQDAGLGDVDPFAAISELTQLSAIIEQSIAVARITLTTGQNLF